MILKKLQAATESGWDKKQTDEVTLLLKCFITDTGELQQIMRALKAAKKGDVTGLKSIQNLKPFSDAHVSEKPLKKSDPDGMKKWDCPCGSGKKVFTCFFETAKSKYDWKTMAKKLAKGGEAQGAGGGSGSTLSFTDRKDKLKAATQEMLSEKHTVLAKIKDQFNDPKLATEYISLGDTFKETILGLEAELEGPKGAGFPMEVLIAHASNAFDAKLASTEKALQDLVKVEKKLFESDDVTQDMYDQAMADLDQVTGLDPMLIAFQMQLAASFGCPLYKMFVSRYVCEFCFCCPCACAQVPCCVFLELADRNASHRSSVVHAQEDYLQAQVQPEERWHRHPRQDPSHRWQAPLWQEACAYCAPHQHHACLCHSR